MNSNNPPLSEILSFLSPGKRLKYIRQHVLKKKQSEFCEDGIIRSGTLKSIETERMKIAPKIAERIIHKLSIEGVQCQLSLLLNDVDPCLINIDMRKKQLAGDSLKSLEEMRKKMLSLIPIEVDFDGYAPFIVKGTILLAQQLNADALQGMNKTLCLIRGAKNQIAYLTFMSDQQIIAEYNNDIKQLMRDVLDFCEIYRIEVIYLQPKQPV